MKKKKMQRKWCCTTGCVLEPSVFVTCSGETSASIGRGSAPVGAQRNLKRGGFF